MPYAQPYRQQGTNWLLIGLVAVSLVVHAGIFLKISGLYKARQPAYLEIHVQKNARPAPRTIPRPPSSPAPPEMPDHAAGPETAAVPSVPEPSALSAPAPVPAPDIPFTRDAAPGIVEWTPPVKGKDAASDSADPYLAALRRRIEEKKSYPAAARRRRIEGRSVVEFMIGADGTASGMRIIRSSRSPLLDQAALEAVERASPFERPPADRFEPPLKLQVPISFEIIP